MPGEAATATLAAAINDPDQNMIGNPLFNTTAVTLRTDSVETANEYAAALAQLGCEARTNIRYENGRPSEYLVVLYTVEDQRRLLDGLNDLLEAGTRDRLDILVRARGPIPTGIMDGIRRYSRLGETAQEIANRLNDAGIVDGMRCNRWTARKVNRALREDDAQRRAAPQVQGAA
jgi:hypothetical protein